MTTAAKACCHCCLLVAVFVVASARASIGVDVDSRVSDDGDLRSVCVGDKDIRNSPAKLKEELKGCVVVEGYLQVVLIENAKQEDFARLSFPQLREVTGYVMFFRVNGLLSLGQLFPNLTLIRGNELALNKYALVVSELPQLMELGLRALQLIMRGSVRIQNNPELCLAESLDWPVVAPAGEDNVFLQNNGDCRHCDCPSGLCWGYGLCRVPAVKKAPSGRDCHKNCAVGCRGTTNLDCTVCAGPEHKGRCLSRCPGDMVLFRGRRCVTAEWCMEEHPSAGGHNYAGGIVINSTTTMASKECVKECLSGYLEVKELVAKTKRVRRKCEPCRGPCYNLCNPASVRSIADARNLKGCTIINGSLEIEIHSGASDVVERELTSALGQVQVIRGSLLVSRSRPLTSLHFFRSLRLINNTDPGREVAIFINDNVNLQYLFDWGETSKSASLAIGPGSKEASFFYNPRLCPEEIDKFAKVTQVNMSNSYNGFINACGKRPHMSSSVSRLEPESVVLTWPAWQPSNEVMEYAIFVARAAARNVTEYSGLGQCDDGDPGNVPGDASLDGWAVHDVRFDRGNSMVSQLVPRLQPATLYAYYIKTYTKESKVNSPIKYFRTKADRPTPPAAARAVAVRPSSPTASSTASPTTPVHGTGTLLVTWEPPPRPNGRLSHYIVVGELRDDDDRRQLGDKDFCEQPPATGVVHESLTPDAARRWLQGDGGGGGADGPDSSSDRDGDGCCCFDCCRVPLDEDQCERLLRGTAEVLDACGQPVLSLDRCAHVLYSVVADNLKMEDPEQNFPKTAKTRSPALDISEQWDVEGVWKRRFVRIESASASSTLVESLVPFGLYSVRIHACGHEDYDDPAVGVSPLAAFCGTPALTAARTLPAPEVDQAVAPNATLEGEMLNVSWSEPPHPNGMVVAYQVRYRDKHRYEGDEKCLTRQSYRQKNGTVHILLKSMFPDHRAHQSVVGVVGSDADRYAVQVRAVSLAGPGGWVDVKVRTVGESGASTGAGGSATAAPSEDRVSSTTTAATVVAALLVVLAVLAYALFVLRRRTARGGWGWGLYGDTDTGRQRLVNPDLTDCWDIPDLPDADALTEPGDGHPATTRVRYQREVDAHRVTIASARTVARSRDADSAGGNGDWHWVSWPSADDAHHPSVPPLPRLEDSVDTRLPSADYTEWHPSNPFHPDNIQGRRASSWKDDGLHMSTQGEEPHSIASRNPFLRDSNAQRSFWKNEPVLTFVEDDSIEDQPTTAPLRHGDFSSQQRDGLSKGFMAAETSTENVPFDDDAVGVGSVIEEMHKSCSTDSFASVNLNESEQPAGQRSLLKSDNNKD